MKRFNLDELLWFVILMLMDLSLIYLLLTDKIGYYIEENMIKYIYISIIIISLISIFQIKNIFTPVSSIKFKKKLILIFLALVIGIISVIGENNFEHNHLDIIKGGSNKSEYFQKNK